MAAFIDRNMTNAIVDTDSSMDKQYLYSEKNDSDKQDIVNDVPTGGFPPIIISQQYIEKPLLNNKQRQFIKPQNNISIRDILNKDHKY